MQIMNHLTLIDHNGQQSSEVEGYLRKLLRTVGGSELMITNNRNEQLSAVATLSPNSDVIIAQLQLLMCSVVLRYVMLCMLCISAVLTIVVCLYICPT